MSHATEVTYSSPPGVAGPNQRKGMWHWHTRGDKPCQECRTKNKQVFTEQPNQHPNCECFVHQLLTTCTYLSSSEQLVDEETIYEESSTLDPGTQMQASRSGTKTNGQVRTDGMVEKDSAAAEFKVGDFTLKTGREIANSASHQQSVTSSGGDVKSFNVPNDSSEPVRIYDEIRVRKYRITERWRCGADPNLKEVYTRVIDKTVKEWMGPTKNPGSGDDDSGAQPDLDAVQQGLEDTLNDRIERHLEKLKAKASGVDH